VASAETRGRCCGRTGEPARTHGPIRATTSGARSDTDPREGLEPVAHRRAAQHRGDGRDAGHHVVPCRITACRITARLAGAYRIAVGRICTRRVAAHRISPYRAGACRIATSCEGRHGIPARRHAIVRSVGR